MSPTTTRNLRIALVLLAIALATWQRACAVAALPPDFDELPYLQAGFDYAERMSPGRWGEIADLDENHEHPPLVKLAFGAGLKLAGPTEPDWKRLRVGESMPDAARPAFEVGRWTSAVPGIGQVAVAAAVDPLAGLLLAGEAYHAKYTSQAYLDAIPGLLFVLALFVFERGTRVAGGARRPVPDLRLVVVAFALLGAAAAGKYPFGAVGVLALTPLTILAFPRRPLVWLALAGAAMVTFFALDPYLWPDPVGRLGESIGFHFAYGQSEDVASAGLPWYQQIVALFRSGPTRWHPGVFPAGRVTAALLPLALIGMPIAASRRPVWAVSTAVGLAFLLVWPVKWPQYLLLVIVPLAICAAHAPAAVVALVRRLRGRAAGPRASTGEPASGSGG
ncbi:MAG TPA: hypothetical protein VK698_04875 [Kofleriaceae bacterium]|nr:hypothetical protein [Kofleriaceae bacterium]